MIDDKKIVEASEKYAKEMEETCKKLAEKYKSTTSLCNWVTVNPEAAFQDGINWFLKNLWHPTSEIPEIGRVIIMMNSYPDGRIEFPSRWRKSTSHNPIDSETQQWLYIEDLFQKIKRKK